MWPSGFFVTRGGGIPVVGLQPVEAHLEVMEGTVDPGLCQPNNNPAQFASGFKLSNRRTKMILEVYHMLI